MDRGMHLRWNCLRDKCFVQKAVPNWTVFDGVGERFGIGDTDGMVEINDAILFIEIKNGEGDIQIPVGQERTLKAISRRRKQTVVFLRLEGDISDMNITGYAWMNNAQYVVPLWTPIDQVGFFHLLRQWYHTALAN